VIVKIVAAIFFLIAFLAFGSALACVFLTSPAAEIDPLDLV
jgi:hypothetical protein